jgi:hypothetical protein
MRPEGGGLPEELVHAVYGNPLALQSEHCLQQDRIVRQDVSVLAGLVAATGRGGEKQKRGDNEDNFSTSRT